MIRIATSEDLPLVRELFRAFNEEIPDAAWRDDDAEDDSAALERAIVDDVVLLADDVGLAVATKLGARLGFLDVLYVRPEARGSGVAAELTLEAAAALRDRGADVLELEVLQSNERARAVYERWGFAPVELTWASDAGCQLALDYSFSTTNPSETYTHAVHLTLNPVDAGGLVGTGTYTLSGGSNCVVPLDAIGTPWP